MTQYGYGYICVYPTKYAHVSLCFVLLWLYEKFFWIQVKHYHIRVASQSLGQSYDCPSASEVTLKDMGK